MAAKKHAKSTKSGNGRTARPAPPFDLDQPQLPEGFAELALKSGGYPYDEPLKRKTFEAALSALNYELVKLQAHIHKTGLRMVIVFEGYDTAGKGGCIRSFIRHLNPRHTHVVALPKPNETERGQWYFQRYAQYLPTSGDLVLFDRSWYNRAGVERVMGFCTADQLADFLREAPQFEGMLVRDGILLHKIFLTIGRETQLLRFHERRHDPLKQWKLTEVDRAAIGLWDEYVEAKEEMFRFTSTNIAPWTVVRANDQRRARLEVIRYILAQHEYEGKSPEAIGEIDAQIVGSGDSFLYDSPPGKAPAADILPDAEHGTA